MILVHIDGKKKLIAPSGNYILSRDNFLSAIKQCQFNFFSNSPFNEKLIFWRVIKSFALNFWIYKKDYF